MKFLFRWLFRVALGLVALVIVLLVFKDTILRIVTEHQIRAKTGMDVSIGSFSSSLFSPVVTIKNMKLYNTRDFGGGLFLDVAELHLEADPIAFADGKIRFDLMRLDAREMDVVINEQGQTNLLSMLRNAPVRHVKKDGLHVGSRKFQFETVDLLNLSLAKARLIDLQTKKNREARIDMDNQVFKNVNSEADLKVILVMIWLRSGGAFNFTPQDFARDYINQKKSEAEATVRKAMEKAGVPLPLPEK